MTGFYEKDTPALEHAREAEDMMRTREHTAKGAKPMMRDLGPNTMITNNHMTVDEGDIRAAQAPFMPRESKMEDRGREEALRIVGAKR